MINATQGAELDGSKVEEGLNGVLQPFKPKPKRFKKDGTPYKPRRGWGPYRSVPNERAAAFNLQLDVQNLQQEIKNLSSLRDILQTTRSLQRESPHESLCRLVNKFFRVFRSGGVPGDREQSAFVYRMMDESSSQCRPDAVLEQLARYSTNLWFICMDGQVDDIVEADDSVVISAKVAVKYQVLLSTIETVFPHAIGNQALVAQLVGQEIEVPGCSIFYFNAAGKCVKYSVDMDFVRAFTSVLNDPRAVDMLLDRALITGNALIGVVDEESKLEEAPLSAVRSIGGAGSVWDSRRPSPNALPTRARSCNAHAFCQRLVDGIVDDYFAVFANGYEDHRAASAQVSMRKFFLQRLSPLHQIGMNATPSYHVERWRTLGESFDVLCFHKVGDVRIECDNSRNTCVATSSARYVFRITSFTIHSVFPHLAPNVMLCNHLVGKVIEVPSQLTFHVERSSGRIFRLQEEMNFAAGLIELLPDRQELSIVLSEALLVHDGVARAALSLPAATFQHPTQPLRVRQAHKTRQDAAAMSMADILS
jgi:hypothetical protein